MKSIFQSGNQKAPSEPLLGGKGVESGGTHQAQIETDPTMAGVGLTAHVFSKFAGELEKLGQALGFQRSLDERDHKISSPPEEDSQ